MKVDIYQKIVRDFGDRSAQTIEKIEALEAATKGLVDDRLIRCIVYLANGDLDSLDVWINQARLDWRDVIMNAEYSGPDEQQVRDFRRPFVELKET